MNINDHDNTASKTTRTSSSISASSLPLRPSNTTITTSISTNTNSNANSSSSGGGGNLGTIDDSSNPTTNITINPTSITNIQQPHISVLHHQQQQQQQQQLHDFHIDDHEFNLDDHNTHHNNMAPMIKSRRDSGEDSFNTSPETGWNGFNFNAPLTNSMNTTNSTFMNHRNNHQQQTPCLELNTSQSMGYHNSSWPMSATSDAFSPTGGIDHIPDFNNPFAINQLGGYQANLVSPGPLQHSTFPTSPPFSASSSDEHAGRHDSIQGRAQSPGFIASANLIRRDGIRKKNARFDIPAERNLKTIDQLISTTHDEGELKELKQQKRLLRNRQAALDSRQRKKQHTERLEEEKKHYNTVIVDLEDALADCKAREGDWIRKEEMWAAQQQQYLRHFEQLQAQQEDLIRQHTLETGDLRRKNALLTEQLQRMESTAMSNNPSSHGISPEFNDFDQMNLGSWNDMSMAQEFTVENTHHDNPVKSPEAEKPAASALLLMLLLCGAWVASRNNSSGSNVLPAIPDEMRVASATVLDNLYKDSGIQLDGLSSPTKKISGGSSKTVLSAFTSAGAFTSNLETLHQRLVTPSQQQLKDQAFSLTPSQYYGSTPGDAHYQQAYYDHNRKVIGGPVQSLQAASVAETYTRSLLRDKVSTQILKDFARMVAQSNIKTPMTWKTESM